MILPIQQPVHDVIAETVRQQFRVTDLPPFAVEIPPSRALGDLAVTVAFQLARTLRKAPRAIAQDLAEAVRAVRELTAKGSRLKPAVTEVAQRLGIAKNELYDRALKDLRDG